MIATTNPYRGFGLSDKQNGTEQQRTVRYRNYYYVLLVIHCLISLVIKQVYAKHTIWRLVCDFCRRIQPYDLWFLFVEQFDEQRLHFVNTILYVRTFYRTFQSTSLNEPFCEDN